MTTITISIPDLSGATDIDVVEVMVKPGDTIAEGDSLIAVETDKASMEIPATHGGTVVEIIIQEGATCNEGDAILTISTEQQAAAPTIAAPTEPTAPAPTPTPTAPTAAPEPVAAPQASGTVEDITVPDLSGAENVDVIEIMVKVGDSVAEGDSLIAVETDKASMEVPSPKAGIVSAITIQEGTTCNIGDVILSLTVAGAAQSAPSVAAPATPAEPVAVAVAQPPAASVAAAPAAVMSGGIEDIKVPDLSGATDIDVVEIMVKVGDTVAEGDSLIAVETDKASMEVPSPKAGVVKALIMTEGSICNEGDIILSLEVAGSAAPVTVTAAAPAPVIAAVQAPAPVAVAPPVPATPVASAPVTSSPVAAVAPDVQALNQKNQSTLYAGPAVRLLAREFGVDLTQIKGSGRRGRILKEDMHTFVKAKLAQIASAPAASSSKGAVTTGSGIPQIPEVDFSKFGEVELVKLSKIAKVTRDNMSRSWLNVPHVTQFDDADITDLEAFRKEMKDEAAKSGVKLTPMPFIIKAVAKALAEHPRFCTSLHADGQHLVFKKYINIGLAVDTPHGLMVPVIKDADKKSIYQIANETVELAGKAKDRKLKPDEMQGACFTISSLGGIGGTGFTPIVNAPEVAILGVSKADIKPRWNGKEFEPRKMLPLCLSYDHRAINGGDAGRFLTYLNSVLSDIRKLVL